MQGARKEFLASLDENKRSTVTGAREDVLCYNALGDVASKEEDYREALRWYRMAEDEQRRAGGTWVTGIDKSRERMEGVVALLPRSSAAPGKPDNPEACYLLAVRYLDAAEKLGATPRGTPLPQDKAERLAGQKGRRMPRQPAEILFRQEPARAQAYTAERLLKEGWFDASGWEVDEGRSGRTRWFPNKKVVVGTGVDWAVDAWRWAFQMWQAHGRRNGIYLDYTELARQEQLAQDYRKEFNVPPQHDVAGGAQVTLGDVRHDRMLEHGLARPSQR